MQRKKIMMAICTSVFNTAFGQVNEWCCVCNVYSRFVLLPERGKWRHVVKYTCLTTNTFLWWFSGSFFFFWFALATLELLGNIKFLQLAWTRPNEYNIVYIMFRRWSKPRAPWPVVESFGANITLSIGGCHDRVQEMTEQGRQRKTAYGF